MFVQVWHNGLIVRSKTLRRCRILAQCDNIVLLGEQPYDFDFKFSIWRLDGKTLSYGKHIESCYIHARKAFAAEIIGRTLCSELFDCVHEINDIIPPKWSTYVESCYYLL